MIRAAAIVLLALAACLAAQVAAAASPAPASARLASCQRSAQADERVGVVAATMHQLAAASRMTMRIDLFERPLSGGRWTLRTDVPGLGSWIAPSDPTLGARAGDVFSYRQAVSQLAVSYAYRFRVRFRWLDGAGAVVRESAAVTRACRQPDLRPDLVLDAVHAQPSPRGQGLVRYVVTVRNAGRSPAARVAVAATLPGDATPNARLKTIGRLLPGESAAVAFTGPGCAAGEPPATFAVDPANAVDERDEANDQLVASCPAP